VKLAVALLRALEVAVTSERTDEEVELEDESGGDGDEDDTADPLLHRR